jgi:hypothetical protein
MRLWWVVAVRLNCGVPRSQVAGFSVGSNRARQLQAAYPILPSGVSLSTKGFVQSAIRCCRRKQQGRASSDDLVVRGAGSPAFGRSSRSFRDCPPRSLHFVGTEPLE